MLIDERVPAPLKHQEAFQFHVLHSPQCHYEVLALHAAGLGQHCTCSWPTTTSSTTGVIFPSDNHSCLGSNVTTHAWCALLRVTDFVAAAGKGTTLQAAACTSHQAIARGVSKPSYSHPMHICNRDLFKQAAKLLYGLPRSADPLETVPGVAETAGVAESLQGRR